MSPKICRLSYLITLIISLVACYIAAIKSSPTLVSASAVSVVLSALYVYESCVKKKDITVIIPALQSFTVLLALILAVAIDSDVYPGFKWSVIPYPILGGAAVAALIAYFGLRFYRELIMVFMVFFTCAISNITGIAIYIMYKSQFDITITNAKNTEEFAAALVWGVICAFIFWAVAKHLNKPRYYDETAVLEARE